MHNQTTYISRRACSTTFVRNRNTVRHTKRSLGSISQIVIVGMLTLVFGLIYVAEGTKATVLIMKFPPLKQKLLR